MKVTTMEYSFTPSQAISPATSTSFGAIAEIMPLFVMILIMSLVMRMSRFMQKPETKAKVEVAKEAALEAAKEWAVRKVKGKR